MQFNLEMISTDSVEIKNQISTNNFTNHFTHTSQKITNKGAL